MYEVRLYNCWGMSISERFWTFDDAAEYWNSWADAPYNVAGKLTALDDGEIIWNF